jgi:stalled ribosome rescue protein Dom34
MATKTGLWINHRHAVIITITDEGAKTKQIKSNVEKHIRAGDPTLKGSFESFQVPADDSHEREFTGHINNYYNEIIKYIANADAILIFGPGEAKNELAKQIEKQKLTGFIHDVETAGRMTDHQIMAKICKYFHMNVPTDKNDVDTRHQRIKTSSSSPSGQI